MIEKLSKKQEALIPVVRDKWIRKMFDGDVVNRKLATAQIEWLYSFSKLGKPIIIFLDSPLGAQVGANMLSSISQRAQVGDQVRDHVGDQVRAQVRDQVRDQVWDQVWVQVRDQVWDQVWVQVRDQVRDHVGDQVRDQVGAQVWAQVWDHVGVQVWAQVWDHVGDQIRAQVWDQVGDQVKAQVWDQVRAQVWDQVGAQIKDRKLKCFDWAYCGGVWDYDWCSFYDFFRQIGVDFKNEDFNSFTSLSDAGVYDMIQFKDLCIVCAKPEYVSRDEENRLHSENGEAIHWKDGFRLWFWHGVSIPGELIISPEKTTREQIIKERNVEVRRCYQEILGSEKYAETLGVIEIDSDTDLQGNNMRLMITKDIDELAGEKIKFADVTCPSTERKYFLCVPSDINNVWDAVAWTFGRKKEEYSPIIET